MKNTNLITPVLLFLFIGCATKYNRDTLTNYLGFEVPEKASNIAFKKELLDPSYKRPYNIFATFKLDSVNFFSFIEKSRLVKYSNVSNKQMCLDKPTDSFILGKVWRFNGFNRSEINKNIEWWKPVIDSNYLFASFYKEDSTTKVITCFNKKWDGKILIAYDNLHSQVSISIEVLP